MDNTEYVKYEYVFIDINECATDTAKECGANTDCTDTVGWYTCACQTGYEGDTKAGCTSMFIGFPNS